MLRYSSGPAIAPAFHANKQPASGYDNVLAAAAVFLQALQWQSSLDAKHIGCIAVDMASVLTSACAHLLLLKVLLRAVRRAFLARLTAPPTSALLLLNVLSSTSTCRAQQGRQTQ